jgi:hypothetical protein
MKDTIINNYTNLMVLGEYLLDDVRLLDYLADYTAFLIQNKKYDNKLLNWQLQNLDYLKKSLFCDGNFIPKAGNRLKKDIYECRIEEKDFDLYFGMILLNTDDLRVKQGGHYVAKNYGEEEDKEESESEDIQNNIKYLRNEVCHGKKPYGLYTEDYVINVLNKRNELNSHANGQNEDAAYLKAFNKNTLDSLLNDKTITACKNDKDKYQMIKKILKYYRIIRNNTGKLSSLIDSLSSATEESRDDIKLLLEFEYLKNTKGLAYVNLSKASDKFVSNLSSISNVLLGISELNERLTTREGLRQLSNKIIVYINSVKNVERVIKTNMNTYKIVKRFIPKFKFSKNTAEEAYKKVNKKLKERLENKGITFKQKELDQFIQGLNCLAVAEIESNGKKSTNNICSHLQEERVYHNNYIQSNQALTHPIYSKRFLVKRYKVDDFNSNPKDF